MYQAFSVFLLAAVSLVCLSLLSFHALTRVPSWPLAKAEAEAADVVALLRDASLSGTAVIYGCCGSSGWRGALSFREYFSLDTPSEKPHERSRNLEPSRSRSSTSAVMQPFADRATSYNNSASYVLRQR